MYRYEVTTSLRNVGFPDDMLRYDQCEITGSMDIDGRKTYVILGKVKPTIGRWNSFLYTVENVEKV